MAASTFSASRRAFASLLQGQTTSLQHLVQRQHFAVPRLISARNPQLTQKGFAPHITQILNSEEFSEFIKGVLVRVVKLNTSCILLLERLINKIAISKSHFSRFMQENVSSTYFLKYVEGTL
jgi:hypothetical protein